MYIICFVISKTKTKRLNNNDIIYVSGIITDLHGKIQFLNYRKDWNLAQMFRFLGCI